MNSTSYEVQVMQGGKWRIHAQFPPAARDDAIEEAKTLESMPGLSGIKVVRDNYDERSGLHKEHVVYKHVPQQSGPQGAAPASAAPQESKSSAVAQKYMARADANRMSDIDFGDSEEAFTGRKPKKQGSGLGVFTKLMLIILLSITISAIVVIVVNGVMPYKKFNGIRLYGDTRVHIMIALAIITFLASMLASYFMFLHGDQLDAPDPAKLKFERQKAEKRHQREQAARAEAQAKKKATEEARRKAEEALRQKAEEERSRKEAEELLKKHAEEDEEEEAQDDEQAEEKDEDADFSNLSPVAEAQKAVLMGFFGEAVGKLPPERKKLDNYNRFGVNLFLAGAAESLGGARNLDGDSIAEILASSLGVMGLKEEHAQAFAKRYEDYLLQDARYMEMFQSGRQTMIKHLDGDKTALEALNTSLHEWNKPKEPEDPEKEVVVMFTDIVGSTAMTHEKGNLAAQEVVRAHNRVVRDALGKTGGLEIKHTGDGIMASFEKVTDSLLATQQMQMMIEMHNQQNPDIPLKVKIGINAGRVVMEEKDLYGVTVQMAARIVDKAKADQIFVSDTVYGMAKGGSWRFVKRGPFYLKGIDGPAYLQECVWDDKIDIAQVQAAAEAERSQLEQAYTAASGKPLPGQAPAPAQEAPAQAATQPPATPAAQPAAKPQA
ncbi:adenylate/guanylate cyclase domain-containing protein [Magnetovibrio sp. PR-2]|uniref:adenylate/guanylate cyclase domain-containing protein n=1 Tax=Magnetovibrio sp. PR-2 TaxID=3120356 RepID=UPI002FCE10EE